MRIDCGNPRSFDAGPECFIEYLDTSRLFLIVGRSYFFVNDNGSSSYSFIESIIFDIKGMYSLFRYFKKKLYLYKRIVNIKTVVEARRVQLAFSSIAGGGETKQRQYIPH